MPKHSFCLWLACLRRLPTQDRIAEWKHDPPDLKCSLCNACMDSHARLFFDCVVSRQIWAQVLDHFQWRNFPYSWDAIVDVLSQVDSAPKSLTHRLGLAMTVYTIWCERNRRLFTGVAQPIVHLVKIILSTVEDRVAWKQRNLKTSKSDVAS